MSSSPIAADLYFNQLQRNDSGIFQSMDCAARDIGRFILLQQNRLLASLHLCGSCYHHPVLMPVVVHLQGKACAGIYCNPFDLKALLYFQSRVTSPWSEYGAVYMIFAPFVVLQLINNLFDILGSVQRSDKNSICSLHHHGAVQSHGRHQSVF